MATIKLFERENLLSGQYKTIETDSTIGAWMVTHFSEGDAFSVYKGQPCKENDITFNFDELCKGGEFVVIETPNDATTAVYIVISLVIAVATIALTPKPKLPDNVNRQQESPNNQLSSRSNQPRPLQRIPDIKGEVLSIPDVIMPTYSMYEGGTTEVEHGYYCVGRKLVDIDKLKDGDTPLSLINGSSAGIYYPNNNPNIGAADVEIGGSIERDIYIPYRSNQVNGLVLSPDYDDAYIDATKTKLFNDAFFVNSFIIQDGSGISDIYQANGTVQLDNFVISGVDISGTYTILARSTSYLMHVDYGKAIDFTLDQAGTVPTSGDITSPIAKEYTDWAYITKEPSLKALINVIAPNGMYKDGGGATLTKADVDYEIQLQEVDDNDNLVGSIMTITETISGNNQQLRGLSTEFDFIADGSKASAIKFACRAKRITPRDTAFNGSVVDEIKLEDVYGLVELPSLDLGDVTTIQTKTLATPFATAVKERQLNCLATEMLNVYEGSGNFAASKTKNTSAVQSFIADSIDPVIGNRQLSEIDADGFLALETEIDTYFGASHNSRFNYTFDSTEITYQEYARTIFNAINCIVYREGSTIKALFERPQSIPAMLFTHRSKLSEKYTRKFNHEQIHDGVEFNYVDPGTNTTETIYLSDISSPVNAKKFNIAGIRDLQQATLRAEREWNKIKNQKQTVEIEVVGEGRYVRPMDLISIVKGTRIKTFDGEVLAQNGLELTLSNDVQFTPNDLHSIILKDDLGKTESVLCTQGSESNRVILSSPPVQALRTGLDSRRTEFSFGNEAKQLAQLWLVQEVDITDKLNVNIKAINYTDAFYAGDGIDLKAFSSGFSEGFS